MGIHPLFFVRNLSLQFDIPHLTWCRTMEYSPPPHPPNHHLPSTYGLVVTLNQAYYPYHPLLMMMIVICALIVTLLKITGRWVEIVKDSQYVSVCFAFTAVFYLYIVHYCHFSHDGFFWQSADVIAIVKKTRSRKITFGQDGSKGQENFKIQPLIVLTEQMSLMATEAKK